METYRAKRSTNSGKPQGKPNISKQNRAPLSKSEQELRQKKKLQLQKQREEKKRLAALRKRRRKQLFRLSFALSLVFVILYWSFVAVSILGRVKAGEDALPLMLFTEGGRSEDEVIEANEITIGGIKYLSLDKLGSYFLVSQFGDNNTRSFAIPETGEYATFTIGTEEAIINSVHVSLSAPALLIDDTLHLPVDFFGEKMTCFDYSTGVSTYGADVLTFHDTAKLGFYFNPCPQSALVAFETVPVAPTLPGVEAEGENTVENPAV